MQVEVVIAWPDRYQAVSLELPATATVAQAVAASALDPQGHVQAVALHGVLARPDQLLCDGDRVELLRPLLVDPKEARRRRAKAP